MFFPACNYLLYLPSPDSGGLLFLRKNSTPCKCVSGTMTPIAVLVAVECSMAVTFLDHSGVCVLSGELYYICGAMLFVHLICMPI